VDAERARGQAEADGEATQQALDRATKTREFLQEQVFAKVRPKGQGLGKDVTMKEVLDDAVPRIGPAFADYPEDEAAICAVLGQSYLDLGYYDPAEQLTRRGWELRQRVLGAEHLDTLASKRQWAEALTGQGKFDEAEGQLRAVRAAARRTLGEEHPLTRKTVKALCTALDR